jgi:23S rRNA (cytosine1962-C5)-methyltransferase
VRAAIPKETRVNAPRLRLRITAAAETCVRAGHPWVFSDSVREQNRDGAPGELAVIFDRQDKFLAVGFFDPNSPIRVRVLHAGKPRNIDAEFWRARLDAALQRRAGLFDEQTTGCRLINGESDGWPGLVLDRYDTTLVMKLYAEAWLGRLEEIVPLIVERAKPERIVLRLSRNVERRAPARTVAETNFRIATRKPLTRPSATLSPSDGERDGVRGFPENIYGKQNGPDGTLLFPKQAAAVVGVPVVFSETGLRFEADVWRGQKTGFFLDQRENRRLVETLAHGRAVLNAFSFSGGFSLYAARGGAMSVTDLDLSAHALESAKHNIKLNASEPGVARCRHESIQADAFEWLAGNAGREFDLIVLDPPSLAKRETERAGAIRAYAKLTENGLNHLRPGGVLVACSCSAHVSAEEFFGAVRQAAQKSGRPFAELQTTRHAADHAATFPEAEYLKGIYLRVGCDA